MADNASITILRNTKANIDAEPIKDGNILFTTDQAKNKIYTDVGTTRIQIGGTVDVDTELSTTSTNPVQNKVITNSINDVRGHLQNEIGDLADSISNVSNGLTNVSNGLTQEVSRATSSDTNLQAQIDQLIAPSGEAPSAAEVQNARIGADGVTYSTLGDAIRTNDNKLKSAIIENDVANVDIIKTALTYSGENPTEGYYLEVVNSGDVLSERLVESTAFAISDYINVENCSLRYFGKGDTNATIIYDAKKNVIGSGAIKNLTNISEVYPNAKYIRFNIAINNYGEFRLIVIKEKRTICSYQVETGSIDLALNHSNRGFATFKAVLDYIDTLPNDLIAPINIYVDEGEYNVLDGYDLIAEPSTFVGPILQNNVNIIGNGSPENIILKAELPVDMSPYAFTAGDVSTINCWKNHIIKNVTLSMYNGRYAMHNDDYKTNAIKGATEIFENVIFKSKRDLSASLSAAFSVGCGAYNGRKTVFKNCVFDAETFVSTNVVVHNNIDSPLPCEWTFESCNFKNGGKSLLIASNLSGQTDTINIKGCKIDKPIRFSRRLSTQTETDYLLYGYGNQLTTETPQFVFDDGLNEGNTLNMFLI